MRVLVVIIFALTVASTYFWLYTWVFHREHRKPIVPKVPKGPQSRTVTKVAPKSNITIRLSEIPAKQREAIRKLAMGLQKPPEPIQLYTDTKQALAFRNQEVARARAAKALRNSMEGGYSTATVQTYGLPFSLEQDKR